MSVLKRASVRQNAVQGSPRWRWRSQLKVPIVAQFFAVFFLSLFTYVASAEPAFDDPNLKNPLDGKKEVSTTRQSFTWERISYATAYRIVVSQYSDFRDFRENPPEGSQADCEPNTSCQTARIVYPTNNPAASYTGFTLEPGTTYYWQVRAGADQRGGYWQSQPFSFTTRSGSSGGGSDSSDSSGDKSGDSSGGSTGSGSSNGVCQSNKLCTVEVKIDGSGRITSSDDSIECEGSNISCGRQSYDNSFPPVILQANALSGYTFKEWRGANCEGQTSSSCNLVLGSPDEKYSDDVITAIFVKSSDDSSGDCTGSKSCGNDTDPPLPPPPQEYQLSVLNSNKDLGTVSSNDGKISCGNDCSETYQEGDEVRLTASIASGSTFSGWSGCPNSSGTQCTISMTSDKSVTANFQAKPTLTVINSGNGGKVSGSGIDCGNSCKKIYDQGQSVTLTAKPESNFNFTGWGGDCGNSGINTQCSLNMNASKMVIATFVAKPQYPLTVSLIGSGTVAGSGMNCSNNICTGNYMEGTPVTLTATHSAGSTFGGWQGHSACNGTGDCSISMTAHQTVTATFNNEPPTVERLSPPEDEPQELDIALTFTATDTEDGVITTTEKVLFKKKTDDKFVDMTCTVTAGGGKSGTDAIFICEPPIALDYSTEYVWKVTVKDQGGLSNQAEKWYFETVANKPPTVPEINNPAHQETGIDPTQDLTLSCLESSGPEEEDVLTYSFYFGDNVTQLQMVDSCTGNSPGPCIIPAAQLVTGQTYFWQCAAKDEDNPPKRGGPWQFKTQANQPPSQPTNLVIKNGGSEVDPASTEIDREQSIEFSWTASEDPEGDAVTYKVCYQPANDTDKTSVTCYQPPTSETSKTSKQLDYGTAYEMFVVAEDSQGNIANSETLTFKTKAAPAILTLNAYSGRFNTQLDWMLNSEDSHKIAEFRILRVEGRNVEFDASQHEIGRSNLSPHSDEDALTVSTEYCYRVDALDSNGQSLFSSRWEPDRNCAIYGTTKIGLESTSGKEGESAIVPLKIPNGGNLKIFAGDICIGFDGDVLEVEVPEVTSTVFTKHFNYDPIKGDVGDIPGKELGIDGVSQVVKIRFNYKPFMEEAPSLEDMLAELAGAGSLADIHFKVKEGVKENTGKDSSTLKFLDVHDNPNLEAHDFTKNCSYLYEGTVLTPKEVPLQLVDDSSFRVKKALRSLRDGNRAPARFYVRDAYSPGDITGDGVVGTLDVLWATAISLKVNGFVPTSEQLIAADINNDGKVDSADVKLLADYVVYQTWSLERSKISTLRRRNVRDGHEQPIVFSLNEFSGISGSTVTTILSVENVLDLAAMNLAITYNTDVISEVLDVEIDDTGIAADILDDVTLNDDTSNSGILRLNLYTKDDTLIRGSGKFIKITFRLASGGVVKSTALSVGEATLYDRYGRNFVTSILQRKIAKQNGQAIIEDVVEEPVIEDRAVETPIEDLLPTPSTTTGLHSATCQLNDHSGNPIAGATVTMGDKTVITDEYGYCAVVGLTEGDYSVTVSQDGYIFLAMPCEVGDDNNCSLNFVNLNVGMAAPALCQIYAVNDKGVKDSQIFTVNLDDFSITVLGEYPKHDLEALDIDPRTGIIYLASGDNAGQGKKGHLYVLDGETGELFPVGSSGFAEIEDLAFSSDGTLWAWAKGDGLITIDLLTGKGTLVYESEWDVEGLTIQENEDGSLMFYAAIDTELWFYDTSTGTLDVACTGLLGETEALEMIPGGLILFGVHNDRTLKLHALEPTACEVVADEDIPTNQFDDVEGIALPTKACIR